MSGLPVHTDPTWIAFSNPLARPWHFGVLELVVFACFAVTVWHVASEWKKGARHHAFQWLVIVLYGFAMELIAFNFIQSYDHALFTVQLYHRELPLYIPCVYIVLHYTGLELVQRLGLGAWREAFLGGFAMFLLDVPFDVAGAALGWWVWRDTDPNLALRWLDVPINSYTWYLLFGGALSLLVRAARNRLSHRSFALYAAFAPLVVIALIVLGTLAFLPYHAANALGAGWNVTVPIHLLLASLLAAFVSLPATTPLSRPLFAIVLALGAFHLAALAAVPTDMMRKLAVSAAAIVGSVILARRGAWRAG